MKALALCALLLAGCPEPECTPAWTAVFSDLDRSVLSIWGRADEVYLVGGGLATPGSGALALRYDGAAWHELPTGRPETLWWVWGTADGGTVFMVGEKGLILRWDGAQFEKIESGTQATFFGVWGSSATDVWIVGGRPGAGMTAENDVVLHWDGERLDAADAPTAKGAALFKVWGAGADDVWVSGEGGTMWRRTPAGWQDYSGQLATRDNLTTVAGCSASEVYAVGGQHVYSFDGTSWSVLAAAEILSIANGVACAPEGLLVVGVGGLKLRFDRALGMWSDETFSAPYDTDFHGAWIAPDGSDWAGGGNFNDVTAPDRIGVVAFRGCPVPAGTIQ